jgi:hypothetical protein
MGRRAEQPASLHSSSEIRSPWSCGDRSRWWLSGRGKFYRKQWHKAVRALARGYGREHSVANKASEVSWKAS